MNGALLVILSTAGESPTAAHVLTLGIVTWCKTEREGIAACLAARVRTPDSHAELQRKAKALAARHGWAITVAPDDMPWAEEDA